MFCSAWLSLWNALQREEGRSLLWDVLQGTWKPGHCHGMIPKVKKASHISFSPVP